MSMSCGIFVQFLKCEILMSGKFVSFIPSCTLYSSRGRGGIKTIKRWVKNNRKDEELVNFFRDSRFGSKVSILNRVGSILVPKDVCSVVNWLHCYSQNCFYLCLNKIAH
jgi:hypothetical protein